MIGRISQHPAFADLGKGSIAIGRLSDHGIDPGDVDPQLRLEAGSHDLDSACSLMGMARYSQPSQDFGNR
jgi:hypothetical protein